MAIPRNCTEENFWQTIVSGQVAACNQIELLDHLVDLKVLGSGSFGVALKCVDPRNHHQYVKKIFESATMFGDDHHCQMLRDEIINHFAVSVADCPYVCKIVCIFRDQSNEPVMLQEYCGHDLIHVMEKYGSKISNQRKIKWITQLLKGLHCVQSLGIMHLDIKPANLLINDQDNLMIIDMGLSIHISQLDYLNSLGVTRGTKGYIPPESVVDHQYSYKNDSFSVGKLILNMFPDVLAIPPQIVQLTERFLIDDPCVRWSIVDGLRSLDPTEPLINPPPKPPQSRVFERRKGHVVNMIEFENQYNPLLEEGADIGVPPEELPQYAYDSIIDPLTQLYNQWVLAPDVIAKHPHASPHS